MSGEIQSPPGELNLSPNLGYRGIIRRKEKEQINKQIKNGRKKLFLMEIGETQGKFSTTDRT
jgi:hypothetical protein